MQDTIRVEAPDLRSAMSLVRRAAEQYRADLVPLQHDTWEIRVAGVDEFGDVFSLVEEWLDDAGVSTTTVHLDGHVYTMNRRVALA